MSPSLSQIFAVFLKIGLLSFGGPAAQIALMHRMLVDERDWLTEKQFLNALSFCMLLPGPEAMQLATYAGWRLHGILGGLIAGLLFVLPGAVVIFALALLYVTYGDLPLVDTLFLGVQAVAVVIVVEALLKVSKRALHGMPHWVLAGLAFVAIFFFAVPFPVIVLAAGLYGAMVATTEATPALPVAVSAKRSLVTILIGLAAWGLPVLFVDLAFGGTILTEIALFFSKLAVVTFGGAYAVLAYMAQDVVVQYGWLTPTEMMDGLVLAETTPGPLILVTQFVGTLAAFREGGYALAIAGGAMTLWVTFIPCFLWIFVGAPYIDWISAQPRLNGALRAITAAVVGVILNLSLWFALHVLFGTVTEAHIGVLRLWSPDVATLNWPALALIALSAVLLLRVHLAIGWVLGISAAAALVLAQI
ncbi:chromate efflux transporter [Marivita geojedonensis]|uniref:Chromate transporter n=1 Tax=Marivita geojedonensis TaxID=1123756 RepID=A0A1X4NM80_9RHOB|nr:chromate efflux transporter [Marivita geojedonensis]OSQ51384.1 chromate transporter [Marivita geojedonensis]PRY77954.1 chromate transporter [Marivita geojedonensis]